MKKLQYITFLLLSVISYGQVTLLTDVNVKEAKPNEPIVLTIVQEVAGDDLVQQSPLRMPDLSKFDIIGTASEQNTFIDQRKGLRVNQFVYQYYLMPKVSGKVKIGSALLTVNGKIYKSEPFDILVKDGSKNPEADYLVKDVYLNLEVSDKTVYENQPTVAVLRAYSKNFDNFRKLENIKVSEQYNAIVKPISYKKQNIETKDDGEYSSQVIATFVIFPEKSGNVEIEPVSALVKNAEMGKVVSNKVKINVKNLPTGSPESFKNAVGNFNVSIEAIDSSKEIEINKPVNVLVKIAGNGNLDANKLPKIIDSEQYTFFKPKITSKLTTNKEGVNGVIAATYVLIPKKSGKINISTEDFSFFDPNLKKYVDIGVKSLLLNVLTPQQIAANKTTLDVVDDYTKNVIETVPLPVVEKKNNASYYSFNWKNVLLNLALLFGCGLVFYYFVNRRKEKKVLKPIPLKPITTIAEEEERIRNQIKPDFYSYFNYLNTLKVDGDFSAFFKTYEDLHHDVETYIERKSKESLKSYVQNTKGRKFFEDFNDLEKLMSIEKYAPIHDQEHLDELYHSIVKIYSEIMN
ncbi:BatD family protein [Cloacibacterium sp.]|uniref:BatD family protein n=1 Tax=Cloacibacterium sp. TaxID=1913682 RepID=UPI0039E64D63